MRDVVRPAPTSDLDTPEEVADDAARVHSRHLPGGPAAMPVRTP